MTYTPPRISIIVPSYNHEGHLKKRLDTLFNQTFSDFEVILLDDASTDGSKKILEAYADRPQVSHFLVNTENSGGAFQQWKKGIRLAEGEYIWIAESDDFSDRNFLETLMEVFERDRNVDLVFCASWYVDDKDNKQKPAPDPEESFTISGPGVTQKYFSRYNLIRNAGSCVFKRKLVDPTFYEYAYFRYCGDWQFWADLAGRAWKIAYLNKRLNYFRIHDRNVSTEAEKKGLYFREGIRIAKGILKDEQIKEVARDQIYRFWGLKLNEAIFSRKDIKWGIRVRILIESFFDRNPIFRYTLWNHKTKKKLKRLLWRG